MRFDCIILVILLPTGLWVMLKLFNKNTIIDRTKIISFRSNSLKHSSNAEKLIIYGFKTEPNVIMTKKKKMIIITLAAYKRDIGKQCRPRSDATKPLRKRAYSNILIISPSKIKKFLGKNSDIFHISAQNIDCGTR